MIIPIIYLGLIAEAELVVALASPIWGIVMHVIIMFVLLVHGSLAINDPKHNFYLALALAPLLRLLSLSMPISEFSQIYWYAIIAVPLLASVFILQRRLGYTLGEVGIKLKKIPLQILIALTGFPLGLGEYFILRPKPLIASFTWENVLLPSFILLIGTGFAEEYCFRGVMQRSATESMGKRGWIFVAFLFGVMHVGYLSVLDVVFVMLVGLFFGMMVNKTKSIIGTTLAHGIANIILYLVIPFFA